MKSRSLWTVVAEKVRISHQHLATGGAVAVLLMGFALAVSPIRAGATTPGWSISPSPNRMTGSDLDGVSCVSATSCKAVGSFFPNNDAVGYQTLIESWNGTAWSLSSSPNVETYDQLNSVSCVSPTSCKAVGYYFIGRDAKALIESWNGSAWSLSSSPNKGTDEALDSVSCVSPTSCKAVGYFTPAGGYDKTLIESWNGSAWSISSSPNKGDDGDQLSDVSCVSATSCKAVGSSGSQTLIESWNGSAWSISSSPNPAANGNLLNSVSCVSTTSCKAVGYFDNGSFFGKTLIESWNGTAWSVLSPTPNKGGKGDNQLGSVSCVSATSCKAVGTFTPDVPGSYDKTLIESWNGSAWSLSSSPNKGTDEALDSVSCVSPASCKAVGWFGSTTVKTLIESYG